MHRESTHQDADICKKTETKKHERISINRLRFKLKSDPTAIHLVTSVTQLRKSNLLTSVIYNYKRRSRCCLSTCTWQSM
jgi:hypothetical protein